MTTRKPLTFFGEPLQPSRLGYRHYDAHIGDAYVEVVDESDFYRRRQLRWRAVFGGMQEQSASPYKALRELEQHVRERTRRDAALCGWELDES